MWNSNSYSIFFFWEGGGRDDRICETSMMANRSWFIWCFQIHVPNKADITSQHITSDLNRLRTSANTHIFPVVEQVRHRRTFSLLSVCLFVLKKNLRILLFSKNKTIAIQGAFCAKWVLCQWVLSFYACTKCCWDTGIWRYSNFDMLYLFSSFSWRKNTIWRHTSRQIICTPLSDFAWSVHGFLVFKTDHCRLLSS